MDFLAPLSRNIIAPLWAAWEKSPYLHHYREMLKTQYDQPEQIYMRQFEDVKELLRHAYRTVPFWKNRMDQSKFDVEKFSSLKDLLYLPLLTKTDLRKEGQGLLSTAFSVKDLHVHKTSGSTGISVVTYRDEACQQFKRAATLRSDEWSGWRLGESIALIWGNPQIRKDWKGRIRRALLEMDYVYLDTLQMNEESMDEFADALVKKTPSMLFGHAHSLYLFASYLKQKRSDVSIRPKAIVSTCMVLHDFEREGISDVFSCQVTNRYGCEEVSLIACECCTGDGLHVNSDCLFVELIDDAGNCCQAGQPGRIVVTDLKNMAMPIIRYEVGDMGMWAAKPCSCGRTLPLLAKIEGRVADYVVTRDGNYISGISLTENFAVIIPGVSQLQIVQEEIDRFTFNIVKGYEFNEKSTDKLRKLVKKYFGDEVCYECVFLDKIPQESSGKYRFCISKVGRCFDQQNEIS